MSEKTTLEGLVCENRIEEAIQHLQGLIDNLSKEPRNSLILLSGRLQKSEDELNRNTVSYQNSDIEQSKIRANFLHILTDVREQIEAKINFFKPIPRSEDGRKTLRDFIDTILSKKYEEFTPFAEGNSFIYFCAKEKHSGQDVMIMVLKSSNIEAISKSNQLKKISRLKHRNLIQLLGVNFQTYPFYLITEFVSGITLKKLIATTGAFPFHNAKRLLLIIGDVANYLRQKRFVHSGIRPSKIIIDHELEPEISPFDILRISDTKRLTSTLLEDSFYFAPEILHLEDTKKMKPEQTDKANQFCIASLGFEMITGEKLFKGINLSETLLDRHQFFSNKQLRAERLAHPRIPKRMQTVLKKMLQENPEKRYDHLLIALSKIERIKSVRDKDEEILFSSYRRCLNYNEDFIDIFYENLLNEPDIGIENPKEKTDQEKLKQEFYRAIHLFFDFDNAASFMKRLANLSTRNNAMARYSHFLKVFVSTVKVCDPYWERTPKTKEAWNHLITHITDSLEENLSNKKIDENAETMIEMKNLAAEVVDEDLSFQTESEDVNLAEELNNDSDSDPLGNVIETNTEHG